jgi:hypothetical protein
MTPPTLRSITREFHSPLWGSLRPDERRLHALVPAKSFQLLERHNAMQDVDVRVDQAFWASSILPEGIVQQWFIADGSIAETGDKMAEIRIEDALHEITAPVRGRLTIVAAVNNVVEPGSLLGTLAVV